MVKKVRRYSTSFKIVLILLGAIATGYFAKLFTTGHKQVILADTVADVVPLKKHKRKHHNKNQPTQIGISAPAVDPVIETDKTVAIKAEPVKEAPVTAKPAIVKPATDSIANNNNSFLYTTYVKPNVTGIVRLRQQDKYYSDIIADIPANARVQVLKKGAMYYQVAYNNSIGFVPKWALRVK